MPATSCERTGSTGDSFGSDDIEDYSMSLYALGYEPFVKFGLDIYGSRKKIAEPN
jgi:vanillate/3-O-methylgallate O-demethylase